MKPPPVSASGDEAAVGERLGERGERLRVHGESVHSREEQGVVRRERPGSLGGGVQEAQPLVGDLAEVRRQVRAAAGNPVTWSARSVSRLTSTMSGSRPRRIQRNGQGPRPDDRRSRRRRSPRNRAGARRSRPPATKRWLRSSAALSAGSSKARERLGGSRRSARSGRCNRGPRLRPRVRDPRARPRSEIRLGGRSRDRRRRVRRRRRERPSTPGRPSRSPRSDRGCRDAGRGGRSSTSPPQARLRARRARPTRAARTGATRRRLPAMTLEAGVGRETAGEILTRCIPAPSDRSLIVRDRPTTPRSLAVGPRTRPLTYGSHRPRRLGHSISLGGELRCASRRALPPRCAARVVQTSATAASRRGLHLPVAAREAPRPAAARGRIRRIELRHVAPRGVRRHHLVLVGEERRLIFRPKRSCRRSSASGRTSHFEAFAPIAVRRVAVFGASDSSGPRPSSHGSFAVTAKRGLDPDAAAPAQVPASGVDRGHAVEELAQLGRPSPLLRFAVEAVWRSVGSCDEVDRARLSPELCSRRSASSRGASRPPCDARRGSARRPAGARGAASPNPGRRCPRMSPGGRRAQRAAHGRKEVGETDGRAIRVPARSLPGSFRTPAPAATPRRGRRRGIALRGRGTVAVSDTTRINRPRRLRSPSGGRRTPPIFRRGRESRRGSARTPLAPRRRRASRQKRAGVTISGRLVRQAFCIARRSVRARR